MHYYLKLEFERNKNTNIITMNQMSSIEEVLKSFNMKEYKPVGTLFDANSKLLKILDEEFGNVQKKKMEGVPYNAG